MRLHLLFIGENYSSIGMALVAPQKLSACKSVAQYALIISVDIRQIPKTATEAFAVLPANIINFTFHRKCIQ